MKRLFGGVLLGLVMACNNAPSASPQEGGANANDRSNNAEEGEKLETGAMTVSPSGAYIVAQRNATTVIVDVHAEKSVELDVVGERFVFSKTREVVYVVLADLKGVIALDLSTQKELWRVVPAFLSTGGAFLARVTDDDKALLVADYNRIFVLDPQNGDIRSTAEVGTRPVDLEVVSGGSHALVVGSTTWADGGPHTPVSLLRITDAKVATIDVPNCAAPVTVLADGSRALLSPTFCTADEEARAKGWSNPDPVSVIDIDRASNTLAFIKNLPGFGPVALMSETRAVAYLDTKRMDPSMFDDKSQVPSAGSDQYHLMTIEPKTMKFTLHPIGNVLPRFAPSKDGRSLLVDASVAVVRNEMSAKISIDARGQVTAEVKGAFGDTSGSLFGAFDLESKAYTAFTGPAATLDRFVQLGDGSHVYTLKSTGYDGDLFAIDMSARASIDLNRSLRDIGILPDGRTLVLRVRLSADAEGYAREEFCFSFDAKTCSKTIPYKSRVPRRD